MAPGSLSLRRRRRSLRSLHLLMLVQRLESAERMLLERRRSGRQKQRKPGAVDVRVLKVRSNRFADRPHRGGVGRPSNNVVLERTVEMELDRRPEQWRSRRAVAVWKETIHSTCGLHHSESATKSLCS